MSLLSELLGGSIYSIKTTHFHYRGFLSDECKLIEGKLKIKTNKSEFIAVVKIVNNEIIKVYNYNPDNIDDATFIFNKFINIELLTECKKKLNINKDVARIPLIETPITELIKQQKIDKETRARERYEEGVARRAEDQRIAEQERRAIEEEKQRQAEQEARDHVEQLIETIIYGTQNAIDRDTSPVEPINIDEVGYDVINMEDIKIFDFIKNNENNNINNSIIIKYGKRIFLFNKNDFNETLTDSAKVHPCIIANSFTTREVELPLRNIILTNVIKNIPLYNLGSILSINILVSQVLLDKFVKEKGNVFITIDKQLYTYEGIASYNIIYNNVNIMSGLHCNEGIEKIDLWSIKKTTPLMTIEEEKELKEIVFMKEEQERIAKEEKERIAEILRKEREEQQRKAKEEQERIAEIRRKEREDQQRIEREEYERIAELRRKEREEYERIAELRRKEKEEQERKEREEQERIVELRRKEREEQERKEREEQERIVEQQRKAKEERIANHHRKVQEFINKGRPFLNEIIEKVSKEKIYWTYTGEWTLNQWIESTRTNEKKASILIKLKKDIDKDLIETYIIADFSSKYTRNYIIENYKDLSQSDYDIFIKYIENLTKQVVNYYKKLRLKYLKYKNKYVKLKKLQIAKQ